VRVGDGPTRALYEGLVALAFVGALACAIWWRWPAALALGAIPLAIGPISRVHKGAAGRELIGVLAETGRLQLGFGALFTLGLALGA
jgi:1,4-dihydroxy-2-naphthoate polyprenyltransferase